MTDDNFDVQIVDALAMPDDAVLPGADLLTMIRGRSNRGGDEAPMLHASNPPNHPSEDPLTRPVRSDLRTGTSSPRGRARLLPSLSVGIGVGVLVAAVLGGSMLLLHHGETSRLTRGSAVGQSKTSPKPTPTGTTVTPRVAYTVPPGDQIPLYLSADPKRRGVWFVTGTDKSTSIVYVSVDAGENRVYPLRSYYPMGADGGIAVASDGTVWAGINMALIHLNPVTGAVTTYKVPTPGDSAPAESYMPTFAKGTHAITAVAVTGTDTVALAVMNSNQVVVFHDERFIDWPLPANTVPEDVAYLGDGTLGVTLGDYNTHGTDRVVTFTANGRRSESPLVDVANLISTGAQFVTVVKEMITFEANAAIVATVPFVPAINPYPLDNSNLGILPNGDLMMESWDGVLVTNLSSGATVDLRFPRAVCPDDGTISVPVPGVSQSPTATPYPAGYLCPQKAELVASDGAGDVWLTLTEASEIDVIEGVGAR